MRILCRLVSVLLLPLALAGAAPSALAAEVVVFSTPTLKASLDEIAPRFEQATGHRLVLRYESVAALKRRIEANEPFDVALLLPATIDDLVAQGRLSAASVTAIARSAIGLAVRAGAPRPDVSTVEAVRATLSRASSYAYGADSASGAYFVKLLERLAIADVASKLKAIPGSKVMQAVASGEAEMTVITVPNILAEPGTMLAGTLPEALQNYTLFTAAASSAAPAAGPGQALIGFLAAPETTAEFSRHGLERPRP